jgi:tetratricopeptide (TPR) repeat protein
LVLYDKLWRTGANMATKVIFSDTVYISGTVVPRGEYSLFSIPSMGDWTLILNKNSRLSGTSGYLESEDIVRVKVRPEAVPYVESFTIGINYLTNNSCYLELMWETLKVSFKIDSDVDNKVLRNIDRALTVNPSSYYQAARYYYETNRDMNIALDWINKSLEESEMFWVVRQKALIQARMGDYAGAIVTAQRSIELAKAAGNSDYVRMNLSSISEWSVK